MHKEPGKRYANAAALADDLDRFLAGQSIQARAAPAWKRAARWTRRRPIRTCVLAGSVLLRVLCAALALGYWDRHHRVKVAFYTNVVRRWGVPEGIGQLTDRQVRRRHDMYKLSRRGGRVEQVEIVNGSGFLTPLHAQVAFLERQDFSSEHVSRPECRYEYRRNDQGELLEETAYDGRGNLLDQAYFGVDGKPTLHKDGTAGLKAQYDNLGIRTQGIYFGLDRKLSLLKDGYARLTAAYDNRGNKIEEAYFGTDGKPALHKDGYARATWAYDHNNSTTATSYFDREGKLVTRKK